MTRSTPTLAAVAAVLTVLWNTPAQAAWTVETVRSGPHVQNPSLAWDAEGVLHMAAQYEAPTGDGRLVGLWRHAGASWTDEVVTEPGTWWSPDLAIPADGDPRILVERFSPQGVLLAAPGTDGAWELTPVASGVALSDPRLVVRDGTLHAAWVQPRNDSANDVRYGSAPVGGAWTTEIVEVGADGGAACVDHTCTSDGSSCALPIHCPDGVEPMSRAILLVSDAGVPHLVYRKGDAVRHAWRDGDAWSHETVATQEGLASGLAADLDAEGTLHVAWAAGEQASEPLRYATNAGGSWSVGEVGDELAWSAPLVEVLVVDGAPHLFYVGSETGCFQELRHAWRTSGKWLHEPVACTTVTDTPPDRAAATVDGGGNLYLAWYDHTLGSRGLRMARRLPSAGADVSASINVSPTGEVPAAGKVSVAALVLNDGPESPVEADLRVAFEPADLVEDVLITNPGPDDTCATPGAAVECTLAGLTAGVPRTLLLSATLRADADGTLTVSATASTVAAEDPDPGNDAAEPVTLEVLPAAANVAIEKSGPGTVPVGGTLAYTLRWSSDGALGAQHVQVVDTLSEDVEFVSATYEPEWNEASRTLTWDMGALPTGVDGELDVTVWAAEGLAAGAEIVNEARITTTSEQERTDDDVATVTTTLTEPPPQPDPEPDAAAPEDDAATADTAHDPGPAAPDAEAGDLAAPPDQAGGGGGGGGCGAGAGGAPLAGALLVFLAVLRRRQRRYCL